MKILFGALSGPQAETELKSLNRIRDLRHPFLLNIERIEVVDGRVVVVTELADRSLDARFREATAAGLKGVPREELIVYLRDAADALDFMSEHHGLQHLDIKPENLLLQGSHAKIGDFGLTKNVNATGNSLVNGFTPLYAPPEVFDGKPERGSDQYSLAIVYQVMLTGVPPFNGRTSAQLMSQHLKSPPDLNPLHPSDRAVVARALSKNPRTRFASCRQFVDELSKRRLTSSSLPRTTEPVDTSRLNPLTAIVADGAAGIHESQILPPVIPLRPPSSVDRSVPYVRPTVILGVGGLGIRAIEAFRQRLQGQFSEATLPLFHFLAVDSDPESAGPEHTGSGIPRRTVHIPLRSSHEYRKVSSDHLNWLSRRWLFNIPRSGNVEGLRPLGRLAFVDHASEIRGIVESILDSAFQPDAVKQMQEQTGHPCSVDGIEFLIVGSTTGGTSSGCVLDLAWLIRSALAERRLPPTRVGAILLHGTGHGRQSADMQDANTISFLKELQHFGLPGVERPGLTSRTSGTSASARPFDMAWFVNLGDDLTSLEFNEGLNSVAEYLQLRCLSPARLEMDAWAGGSISDDSELQLRTFGIAQVASEAWQAASREAVPLCLALLQRWMNAKPSPDLSGAFATPGPDVAGLVEKLSLTSEGIINLVPKLLTTDRSRRVDEYATTISGRLSLSAPASELPALIAGLITEDTGTENRSQFTAVVEEIRRDLSTGLQRSSSLVEAFLAECLDGRGHLGAAEEVVATLLKATDNASVTSGQQRADLQQAFADLCDSLSADLLLTAAVVKAFCRQYCMLLVCQTVCQSVAGHLKLLRDTIQRLHTEQLATVRRRLGEMCQQLISQPTTGTVSESSLLAFEDALVTSRLIRISAFRHREPSPTDLSSLQSLAANLLFTSAGGGLPESSATSQNSDAFPGSARPLLRNVGGGQRILAAVPDVVPADHWKSTLQEEFGPCVSVCQMHRNEISVLCEVEGIAVTSVLQTLSQHKPRIVELAGRVHSRQDIPW